MSAAPPTPEPATRSRWLARSPEQLVAALGPPHHSSADLATGRGATYEWEFLVGELLDRLAAVEGTTGVASFTYQQNAPAATWSIVHNLGTHPSCLLIDLGGHVLLAEVIYPDTNTTVVIHALPYAGTAYLRG